MTVKGIAIIIYSLLTIDCVCRVVLLIRDIKTANSV